MEAALDKRKWVNDPKPFLKDGTRQPTPERPAHQGVAAKTAGYAIETSVIVMTFEDNLIRDLKVSVSP